MNRQDYLEAFQTELETMSSITEKKNADYAEDTNALANFNQIESITNGMITAPEGILVRMTDKLKRIGALLYRDPRVSNEALEDTVIDLANYAVILKICLKDRAAQQKSVEVMTSDTLLSNKEAVPAGNWFTKVFNKG